jgi:hypothetical protein
MVTSCGFRLSTLVKRRGVPTRKRTGYDHEQERDTASAQAWLDLPASATHNFIGCPRSSTGQSGCLLSSGLQVRVLPGAPYYTHSAAEAFRTTGSRSRTWPSWPIPSWGSGRRRSSSTTLLTRPLLDWYSPTTARFGPSHRGALRTGSADSITSASTRHRAATP